MREEIPLVSSINGKGIALSCPSCVTLNLGKAQLIAGFQIFLNLGMAFLRAPIRSSETYSN